jgi:CheY-like chemotaxis protein
MEELAVSPLLRSREGPRVQVLLADDDSQARRLLAVSVLETLERVAVLEAEDGAEAVELGLRYRPQIAILDVTMPKLGGFEAALTLRELQPGILLAVRSTDLRSHRDQARTHRLTLFDKLHLPRALDWLEIQVRSSVDGRQEPKQRQVSALECSSCGYGIACPVPPARCPMCQAGDTWIDAPCPPFRTDS